ncbi:catechol 1,2-dioxygenase 1 [Trichosporon asahii var. asahii CBS 8904]|uniref:Catechol 1,2-dioxygenase 1 n=1 Tax=Trichosporon asahii var. asahii (strain CBS 8904) TaxID=1220162 RepID=K1VPF5_TRIAC|nr:catechol 1,2-dioxygenase 1 [Trichosporon asahii var. asahii CBS 8904]
MSNFDFSDFTKTSIDSIGAKASPRVKEVMPILLRKLHEFLVEADVTHEEMMAAFDLLVKAGQVSDDKRNEILLIFDILGVESLVDALDQTRPARKGGKTTEASPSAILGPFYRYGVPEQPNGTTIIRQDEPDAPYTHLYGTIYDGDGKPLPNAVVDIWHDAPDGLYDAQTPEKPEYHCRGRFRTDENGRYDTVCLRPTPYPIPYDHQAGQLLTMMDRHPYRPAHIHYWIEADGHRTLVSQIFDRESDYLTDDAVFAVKDKLIVDFKPIPKDYVPPKGLEGKMKYELEQDFRLERV